MKCPECGGIWFAPGEIELPREASRNQFTHVVTDLLESPSHTK